MFAKLCANRVVKFSNELSQMRKIVLPDLKYGYAALEPVFSGKLLQTHHKKHHQTYVNNVNNIMAQIDETRLYHDVSKMGALLQTLAFNIGGHINHSLFWDNLAPIAQGGGQLPSLQTPLSQQIVKQYGSYTYLIDQLSKKTTAIQGSGWGWLAYDKKAHCLRLLELPNQQIVTKHDVNLVPLLAIDAWEHSYYIDYKNLRLEYVKQIWKIINWKEVERRYAEAIK